MKFDTKKIRIEILKAVEIVKSKGWKINSKVLVTWEPYGKECCPMGAVAIAAGILIDPWRINLSHPAIFLNVNKKWVFDFAAGFDSTSLEASVIEYKDAYDLGKELRKTLL